MRIVFFGSGAFGLPTLERLAREHSLSAIVTQPDRPAGRRQEMTPTPIGDWAARSAGAAPLIKPENVNDPAIVERLRAIPADAWVVIAFGQKLGPALLADRFAINLHASLLPRWRGAAPINHAILAGDAETGVTVITLADRMDAGLILAQSHRPIDPLTTAGELHDALAADGPDLVSRVLSDHTAGRLAPRAQDESLVTKAPKLSRADARIDFAGPADAIRRRVHALNPWPGVSVRLDGKDIKLLRVQSRTGADEQRRASGVEPGRFVDPDEGLVACGRGAVLELLEVQPAGGRTMKWTDFIRGRRISAGAALESIAT